MSKININPYDTLTGIDGLPLDQGYIYIGVANLDPRTNPLTVYWDAAMTQPINQPIRTANGRVWNAGSIALVYAAANYSLQVLDKNQAQVLVNLNVTQPVDNPVPISQGGTGATTAAGALANLGVISAIVQQTYAGYTTAGIATAFTLTPVPAIVASPARTRFNVTFHLAGSGAPTLSISGLPAKALKQYDGLGAKTTAIIKLGQVTDIVDDGTDYVLLDPLPPSIGAASGIIIRRQCPQFGLRDTNGLAAFLGAGAALNFNVLATAVPLTLAYAAGEGASGSVDLVATLAADAANQGALAANNTNYIYSDYVNAGAVTWGNTRAPRQDGFTYDRTRQAVLQFGGVAGSTAFPDDFGNGWAAIAGAKIQANQFKFGTGALGGGGALNILNGATDYLRNTTITSLGVAGWSLRAWGYATVLPGAGAFSTLWGCTTASGVGATLAISNNAGTIKFAYYLSGDGTTPSIANNTQGTTTPVASTWYFVELTYDALAGAYRLYVNGAQEASTASAVKIAGGFTKVDIGASAGGSFWTGYIDKPEFLPYCEHPGGTAYAAPAAAPSITTAGYASEWYDPIAGVMKTISAVSTISGTDPAFTPVRRLYCGEQDTNGANVTATRSYAYQRRYASPIFTIGAGPVKTNLAHNLGVLPLVLQAWAINKTAEAGFTPGQRTVTTIINTSTGNPMNNLDRNNCAFQTGASGGLAGLYVISMPGGTNFTINQANWNFFVEADGGA